jgi:hypothetical protein
MRPTPDSRPAVALTLTLLATGCGRPPEAPPPDTGSREAARAYFTAIARRDWPAALDALDPDSRRRHTAASFAKAAQAYRQRLGFDADGVQVRACEEHGDGATAHFVLTGKGPGRHQYRDAVTLRRTGAGWRVVLPTTF